MARRAEARVYIVGDASGFHSAMRKATWSAMSFQAKMQAIGGQMQRVGRGMTYGLTLPLALVGAASVKMALEFEDSMTKIRALVGASEKQMKSYEKAVLGMAGDVGKAPKELADALYFVTSAGFKGEQALKILSASAKASAAGLGTTAVVADAVTSALNAYGVKALSATKATDVLTAAVREGKAEPEEFAAAIGRVIPVASKMGVSFGEVAGMMAAMSLNGTKADEAVTQINAALSTAMKSTPKGAAALKSIGMSYEDLRKSIADKGLLATFQKLDKAYGGNVEQIAALFGNVRALRGILTLTGASAEKYRGVIERVSGAQGDANKAFEETAKSSGFKLKQAMAGLKVVAIEVGAILIPVVTQAAKEFGKLVKWFSGLSEGTKTWAVKLAVLAAALGPVIWLSGSLLKGLNLLIIAYKSLRTVALAAAAAQKASTMAGLGAGAGAKGAAAVVAKGGAAAAGGAALGVGGALASIVAGATAAALVIVAGAAIGYIIHTMVEKMKTPNESPRNRQGQKLPTGGFGGGGPEGGQFTIDTTGAGASIADLEARAERLRARIAERMEAGKLNNDKWLDKLTQTQNQINLLRDTVNEKMYAGHLQNEPWNDSIGGSQTKLEYFKSLVTAPMVSGHLAADGWLSAIDRAILRMATFRSMVQAPMASGHITGLRPTDHAAGGVFRTPHFARIAESGPEAIIPLTRPARARQVMQQAGLAGAGGGTVNVNVMVPGGTTLIGTAREVADVLAPHIARALGRREARHGRGR